MALKNVLAEKGVPEFFWIGEAKSLEERVAQAEEIPFFAIRSGKFRRYFSLQTVLEPFNVLIGFACFYLSISLEPGGVLIIAIFVEFIAVMSIGEALNNGLFV